MFRNWYLGSTWSSRSINSFDGANALLVAFVEAMHDKGERFWLTRHGILAVQTRFQALRGRIPRPWDALRGWKQELRVRSRVPMSPLILEGIFGAGLARVTMGGRMNGYLLAGIVLLLVGFEVLLRPIEILRLRARDIQIAWFEGAPSAVIAKVDPKNRSAMGAYQFARVQCSRVARCRASPVRPLERTCARGRTGLQGTGENKTNTYIYIYIYAARAGGRCMVVLMHTLFLYLSFSFCPSALPCYPGYVGGEIAELQAGCMYIGRRCGLSGVRLHKPRLQLGF